MQKTLELLKKGDGITIKKLSYKKLLVQYQIPVISSAGDILGYQSMSARFKVNDEFSNHFDGLMKPKFWQCFSMRWAIKMKNVYPEYEECNCKGSQYSFGAECHLHTELDVPFDGSKNIILKRFIRKLVITDQSWVRDFKLKQILNGKDF